MVILQSFKFYELKLLEKLPKRLLLTGLKNSLSYAL